MQISASGHITTNTDTNKTRIVIDGSSDPSQITFYSASIAQFEFKSGISAYPEITDVDDSDGTSCTAASDSGISGIRLLTKTSGILASNLSGADDVRITPGRIYVAGDGNTGTGTHASTLVSRRQIGGCRSDDHDIGNNSTSILAEYVANSNVNDTGNRNRSAITATSRLFHASNAGSPVAVLARATTANSSKTAYSFSGTAGVMYNADEARFGADVIAFYSSDRRFKDNIFVIESPIDKIKKISGVEFDWNEKGPAWTRSKEFGNPSGSLHDVGVVAQEIQSILPEAVKTRKDGYLAVDYEKIIPLLIEGIKEQQTTIEDLNARIKKLENN